MTQDMIKTIRTIKMMNNGKSTQKEPSLLCTSHKAQTVRLARTTTQARADHQSGWGGLWRSALLLLVMMTTMGVGQVWADDDPYVGIWYINNQRLPNDGYYFVPTINCFYDGDEDQPHLTTFKTGKDKNSIWRIESVSNGVYRIIHNATGKYLMVNDAVPELKAAGQAQRKRVHLETVSTFETDETKDKSLFVLTQIGAVEDKIVAIKSKNVGSTTTGDGSTHLYLNPKGNEAKEFDYYRAQDGRGIKNYTGIVGFYGNDSSNQPTLDANIGSRWKLESANNTCANPVIQYNDAGTNIQISYPIASDTGWTIYYTTDGSDPSTNANREEITSTSSTITDLTGVTKVRAIATKTGWDDSDETVLIASGVTQMVQSKQCDAFYMVPPIVVTGTTVDPIYATTTNIPNAKMGWNFVPAGLYCGIQYYNIINAETKNYLYCSGGNGNDNALTMMSNSEISTQEQIDRSKFRLIVQADGSYKIISKWWAAEKPDKYYVNKKNGNNSTNALNLADGSSNTALWNVITAPSSPKTQFDASYASSSSSVHFYEIQSATDNTYHVIPPTTSTGKATANTTGANPAWFFMPVEDNDTWIPYYHIRNAATGEYLYYNSGSFYTSTTVVSGNEDRYMFIVVKSAYTTDPTHYNIIPKALKDQAKQEGNSLNRNGTTLRILDSRNKAESNWKLEEVALFCNDPVFTETEGSISISCIPDITKIYYTTDGSTPTTSKTLYSGATWPSSSSLRLKAVAIISNDEESASSDVFSLFNNPDITLKESGIEVTDATYTYNGIAHEPDVTVSVSTGGDGTTIIESSKYNITYSDNLNVGTAATVTVTDKGTDNHLQIWNIAAKNFTINPAPLTIAANNNTIGYGDEPANNGVTYTGFVGSPVETETVLGGSLTYTYTTQGENPQSYTPYDSQYGNQGNYVITPSGLTSTNYDITFEPGVLTVGKKSFGNGSLAAGFTLEFIDNGEVILKYGEHALTKDVDYTIGSEVLGTKYSSRTISGTGNDSGDGNYTGSLAIRSAIVHFTTDASQEEWSATFAAENALGSASNNSANGHALPEGITAYIITSISGNNANAEALEYIPEGIPVLLLSNAASGGFLVQDASGHAEITSTQISNNMLEEVSDPSKHFDTREIYLLYNNEFVHNMEGDLAKGKVYLNPSHTAPDPDPTPSRLFIRWDTKTGIDNPHLTPLTPHPSGPWYTLDGRRLNRKPTQKGLYLCNGQKMVVN